MSATNDANTTLISELQALLQLEENLSNTLNQIETFQDLEQPIQLTGLNVVVLLDDAAILTEAALVAAAYAYFAYEAYTPNLVTKTTPGAYSVTVPSGAKYVDIVLIGGGGGGGGYNNAGTGSGGNGDIPPLPRPGGPRWPRPAEPGAPTTLLPPPPVRRRAIRPSMASPTTAATAARWVTTVPAPTVSPRRRRRRRRRIKAATAGPAAPPAMGHRTLAVTSGITTITGTVGAGGTGGSTAVSEPGGTGATGEAFFNFYS